MSETLSDLGEFGLIHRIDGLIRKEGVQTPGVTLGIGDDTACFQAREGFEVLVTCDCMVEGRHYLPHFTTPRDLGRRAMALNISDIGAMGGKPLYALISLGLRGSSLVHDVEEMYQGFLAELSPLDATIIGGNLTKSGDGIFIDITLIGEVEQGKAVRRSTAKAGDAILVTGYPGQAAAGLQLLLQSSGQENLKEHLLVRCYTTPSHRALEGRAIALSGLATAMIDISDGLLGDLGHICEDSGVGADLFQERLPVSEALREAARTLKQSPYDLVLQDSDDYELIITCSPQHVDEIRSNLSLFSGLAVTEVGSITPDEGRIHLLQPDGSRRAMRAAGWDHFTK